VLRNDCSNLHAAIDAADCCISNADEYLYELLSARPPNSRRYRFQWRYLKQDLLRTSGEFRISNFLLWQLTYSEMIFIDKPCWSSVEKDALLQVIKTYAMGQLRRLGKQYKYIVASNSQETLKRAYNFKDIRVN
jgi:hypothetical protein